MTVYVDGMMGEGGGQVLRTSLSLAAVTGNDLVIENIRGKRKKPGLKRQHLVSVKAAALICDANCEGDFLNSQRLVFRPGKIRPGEYVFDIGTAGSCCLVLQTLFPILFNAASNSTVTLRGGTHNPMAPSADFLARSFLPAISKFGFHATADLLAYGFYPAGGGKIKVDIVPGRNLTKRMDIIKRGNLKSKKAKIIFSKLPRHIAEREKKTLLRQGWMNSDEIEILEVQNSPGPGNAVIIVLDYENITCVFQSIGEKGKRAENVAMEACKSALFHHRSALPVEKYLTDQLLIYLGLISRGSILTSRVSLHSETNMKVIEMFLPVKFEVNEISGGQQIVCSKA